MTQAWDPVCQAAEVSLEDLAASLAGQAELAVADLDTEERRPGALIPAEPGGQAATTSSWSMTKQDNRRSSSPFWKAPGTESML